MRSRQFPRACSRCPAHDRDIIVGESLLVITYSSHDGSHRGPDTRNHVHNNLEMVMIVHKKTQDGSKGCTINERDIVGNAYGFARGTIIPTLQSLGDIVPPQEHPTDVVPVAFLERLETFR